MAKIYGLFGSMTGKVADVVMAVRNGEQIARKYQPVVSNPKSAAQVTSRAKLKLMSQLSAVMAPVIAIPRMGSVSSRNMFVKVNYKYASYSDETASVTLTAVQLTKSVVGFPAIAGSREQDNVNVVLNSAAVNVDRVVYLCFVKGPDNTLRFYESKVISEPGTNGRFAASFSTGAQLNIVIYAYGVRDNTQSARVTFGNLIAPSAEDVAKIVTSRILTENDITLTETQAVEVAAAGV